MQKEKKKVFFNVVDCGYWDCEPVPVLLHLLVDQDMEQSEIEHAIRLASKEYCKKENIHYAIFNYNSFNTLVPNEICEKYGISKLEIPFEQMNLSFDSDLVGNSCYFADLMLDVRQADELDLIANMDRESIQKLYGKNKDRIIRSFDVDFSCGIKAEIRMVTNEMEKFHIEGILYDHEQKVSYMTPSHRLYKAHCFQYQGDTYIVRAFIRAEEEDSETCEFQ